jgi:hypothetical protein
MKTAATKSCCKDGGKVASKTTDATQANVIFASEKKTTAKASDCTDAKECVVKGVKMTAAECAAHCAAMKTKMTKASTTPGCCKDKAKTVRAEKKSTDKTDAKGTN